MRCVAAQHDWQGSCHCASAVCICIVQLRNLCLTMADIASRTLQEEADGMLQQQILLSTEDTAVIAWFAENATGWTVEFTNSTRKPDRQ